MYLRVFWSLKLRLSQVDEHFGISVVEFLAAGLVVIAHASGGPKDDILTPEDGDVGFLCSTADEYATGVH